MAQASGIRVGSATLNPSLVRDGMNATIVLIHAVLPARSLHGIQTAHVPRLFLSINLGVAHCKGNPSSRHNHFTIHVAESPTQRHLSQFPPFPNNYPFTLTVDDRSSN